MPEPTKEPPPISPEGRRLLHDVLWDQQQADSHNRQAIEHVATVREYISGLEQQVADLKRPLAQPQAYQSLGVLRDQQPRFYDGNNENSHDQELENYRKRIVEAHPIAQENDVRENANEAIFTRLVQGLIQAGLPRTIEKRKRSKVERVDAPWYAEVMEARPKNMNGTKALAAALAHVIERHAAAVKKYRDKVAESEAASQRQRDAVELARLRRENENMQAMAKSLGFDPAKMTPEELRKELSKRGTIDGRERGIAFEQPAEEQSAEESFQKV